MVLVKTGYKVGEVMTQRPIAVGESTDLASAAEVMEKNNVGAVLVTDENQLLGILTEQDVVRKLVAKGETPTSLKVKDVMGSEVNTVPPAHDIEEALMTMSRLKIRHLPVIEDNNLVGLLTLNDILKLEPQLFELIAHRIELREEERKPLSRAYPSEGLCNLCGDYTKELIPQEGVVMCPQCLTAQSEEPEEEED